MKVLIATPLYPPDIGGPATYAEILARELPRRGLEAQVYSFGDVRRFPKLLRHLIYGVGVWKRAREADIVYALDPVSVGLPALLAARLAKRRFLLRIAGDYAWEQGVQRWGVTDTLERFAPRTEGYPPLVLLLKKVECFVALRAEAVVVPSQYLKKIIAAWGVPKRQLHVIYNSFEPPVLSGNRAVLRGLIKFEGPLVASVGRLVPWKGFAALIEALPRLRKKFPGLKLFILGKGPEEENLMRRAQEKNLEDAVIFGGSAEHEALVRYLEAADLFILNTRYEGFSHVLLEAMAVGIPVITTPVGGNAELAKDGQNSLLVQPDNEEEIVAAAEKLLPEGALRQRLIAGGKETVARFTIERMISELIPILARSV